MDRCSGKTAVVTGASAGIGAAIAIGLAENGVKVIGLARRDKLVDELNCQVKGPGKIIALRCDVTKPEQIACAFETIEKEHGGCDIMINNAGRHVSGHITDVGDQPLSDEDVITVMDLNVKGLILCTRKAAASMKRRCVDGHIVCINSIAGHYEPFAPSFNIYPATKHAVTAFAKALLNELAQFDRKIRVTSVSPGLVATELTEEVLSQVSLPALDPRDVADAVLYCINSPPHVNITEISLCHTGEKRL